MPAHTTEHAYETYATATLTGAGGWTPLPVAGWSVEQALFPEAVVAFLRESQPKAWAALETQLGAATAGTVVATLAKELDLKGALTVLRHGFKCYGKTLRMAYFKPAHGVNYEALEQYHRNRLTVTRQVPCHPGKQDKLDMLLALNGIPVATVELKNPGTGQTWRDAVVQYRDTRHPGAPVFDFKKRTLVHFAVDPDEVHMTTHLAGEKTRFLPLNRGDHPGDITCGPGNPQHPSGHRTGYLWEEVLHRDSFLDILGGFLFLEKKEEKVPDGKGGFHTVIKETLVFPRYHQLDAVRRLVGTARAEGAGHHYLVQHSAGSGKTNSISWLAHRLSQLHTTGDAKIFDCVVVITDRQVLDRQLQDAIYQIEHAQGVVKAIDKDARQLAEALIDGTKIVVTTLQKFPFVLRGLMHAAGGEDDTDSPEARAAKREQTRAWEAAIAKRRYAIIVDEAHSSQSGETARELKSLLGSAPKTAAESGGDAEDPDWEDGLNAVMLARGRQPNLSFFAFTATPKGKTLELFGRPRADGLPGPFHLYSMRQAIGEKFILDVLANYTTYATYYRLVKAAEDDPSVPKKKAAKALGKFMSLHPHNLAQKTEVMVEHFRRHVRNAIGGRAKAMVVTASRLHAVRYMRAFERYIAENGYTDIRPLVAFSGTVKDPETDAEYTEPGMNLDCVSGKPMPEAQLPERFATPDYQVLLVANKYQTGFDQPLLTAMYVDKRLDGVQAVQTLSRLNRSHPGKETPFVLDFVNQAEDILRAFRPYYDATSLEEASDPHQLDKLKHELDAEQVYHASEVEAFAHIFYRRPEFQSVADHAHMQKHLQPAVDRFKGLPDDERRTAFREKLGGYVRVYAFLSQIIPYADRDLEMLHSFGKHLLPHLQDHAGTTVTLTDEVALHYYRLQRVHEGAILVNEGEAEPVRSTTAVGTGKAKEESAPLSEVIRVLNDRFGTHFTDEDRLFFEQIREKAANDEQIIRLRQANPFDKFQLGLRKIMEKLMIQRMAQNDAIVTRYMDDKDFESAAFAVLSRAIYEAIPPPEKTAAPEGA